MTHHARFTYSYDLPGWTDVSKQSKKVQQQWARLLAVITAHEMGHKQTTEAIVAAFDGETEGFLVIACQEVYKNERQKALDAQDADFSGRLTAAHEDAQSAYHMRVGSVIYADVFFW